MNIDNRYYIVPWPLVDNSMITIAVQDKDSLRKNKLGTKVVIKLKSKDITK